MSMNARKIQPSVKMASFVTTRQDRSLVEVLKYRYIISTFFRFSCAEEENCVNENMNGNVEYSDKTTEEQRNRETKRSCIDVTAQLSPVSRFARYCTQPEVKFDAFIRLKHRKKK